MAFERKRDLIACFYTCSLVIITDELGPLSLHECTNYFLSFLPLGIYL